MTVKELIEELEKQNPMMEVMHVKLSDNGQSFVCTSINSCSYIRASTGESFVGLDAGFVHDDQDYSLN